MKKVKVAVLGATGAVGEELLGLLVERNFPATEIKALASAKSAGKKLQIKGREFIIEEAKPESFDGIDIAFFCAGGSISKAMAQEAVKRGAVVIDNTSAFRMDPEVPLVVPEVNPEDIKLHKGIIANPNCSTIIMLVALAPLERHFGLQRIIVSTYQAVSGAGVKGMEELDNEVNDPNYIPQVLPVASLPKHYPIAYNLIPQIDVFDAEGYTKEEWKMIKETQKMLHRPELGVTATTIRVPVKRCHSESVYVELNKDFTLDEIKEAFSNAPGLVVLDDPENQVYPMPLDLEKKDDVYIGRIRRDLTNKRGLNFWVVGDQIRKGAALNAVQIGERLLLD